VLDVTAARAAMCGDPDAVWIQGRAGDTPGSLRQRALKQVAEHHSAVVLVDSDDIMHPTRVETAREMLRDHDLAGCALRLVDAHGADLSASFGLSSRLAPDAVLPRANAFGLSNSAVRAGLLQRCLPIPDAAVLVDWFLSTRAWLFGARLGFSDRVEMDYRQHGSNTARVRAPFSEQQLIEDTARVRAHFALVLRSDLDEAAPGRVEELKAAAADVELFHERVLLHPGRLSRYVEALNGLEATMLWWAWVAHPSLRQLWATEERTV
jgi:hypothetical protein